MASFSWVDKSDVNPANLIWRDYTLTIHPHSDGVLFTIHGHMTDHKTEQKFCHTQSNFTADIEQVYQITNLLLIYLKELEDGKSRK